MGRQTGDVSARPRKYDAPRRREQAERTRAAVLAAAHRLFVQRGWAATGVRDIAREAEVSVKTVYDTFGSKADLLKTVVDVAIVGDDEPVPVMERQEFAAVARGDLEQRAAAGARLAAEVNRRTVELKRVWRVAADSDPGLAARLENGTAQQRHTARAALALVAGDELDPDDADGLWALSSDEMYLLLVQHAGWSHERYEAWLARVLVRLLRNKDHHREGN